MILHTNSRVICTGRQSISFSISNHRIIKSADGCFPNIFFGCDQISSKSMKSLPGLRRCSGGDEDASCSQELSATQQASPVAPAALGIWDPYRNVRKIPGNLLAGNSSFCTARKCFKGLLASAILPFPQPASSTRQLQLLRRWRNR